MVGGEAVAAMAMEGRASTGRSRGGICCFAQVVGWSNVTRVMARSSRSEWLEAILKPPLDAILNEMKDSIQA